MLYKQLTAQESTKAIVGKVLVQSILISIELVISQRVSTVRKSLSPIGVTWRPAAGPASPPASSDLGITNMTLSVLNLVSGSYWVQILLA